MKIAITGASGFIGKHVMNCFARKDIELVAVTRQKDLSKNYHNIKIIEHDIADLSKNTFKKLGKPDLLVHLAWDGLPNYNSLHHFETELPKQYNFLKLMVESGLKSLFVTGTCFEYGMQSGVLAPDAITNPTNSYGLAKDTLRKKLKLLQQVKPFNFKWARLFYMYGEGQASNSLYSQLRQAIIKGDETFNMSGGEQVRDYLPVEKIALKIVELSMNFNNRDCENICSGKPTTVKDLVEGWLEENGWSIKINLGYYPYPEYEPMAFWGTEESLRSK
jgi:nucleoside-diphosphate-sugar epimerase